MKLFINKDQAKGLLGGTKFEMKVRTELTSEEIELVKKYKAEKEILLKKDVKIPLTGKALSIVLTIDNLINGHTFSCSDIGEILEYEKNVKESCEAFKNYIEIMRNFGGQEIIEFK